jgi:transcriptional regulator with XRE-family HTH domain
MTTRVTVSDQIAGRVRDLRKRADMSRSDLAGAAQEHGAAPDFTEVVVGHLENGRPRNGVRTRLFGLDEVFALAGALEVSPVELLGDTAQLFVGDTTSIQVECPKCAAGHGEMQRVTRADLARLGDLSPTESTLAETAYRLAEAIDEAADPRALPALTRELRATVQELRAGRRRVEKPASDDDDFDDLDVPD